MDQDYYLLLGVGPKATEDEIVKAYKRMALIYHPDKNNHPESVEHFKKIGAAFKVLSNKVARANYDRNGRGTATPGPSRPSTSQQSTAPDILPVLGVIGVGILGVFGLFQLFNNKESNNNDGESDNDE
ncbi:dnaJ protein homolog 1-like isoform X2 [Drosophila obscura]|nr:dnaJ protein homolog 1-like isoform X2 [Drosophila obscura]